MRDAKDSTAVVMLFFDIARCDVTTQPENFCASDEESEQYFITYDFYMMTLQNFIDYDNVDPGVGPVERMSRTIQVRPFDTKG